MEHATEFPQNKRNRTNGEKRKNVRNNDEPTRPVCKGVFKMKKQKTPSRVISQVSRRRQTYDCCRGKAKTSVGRISYNSLCGADRSFGLGRRKIRTSVSKPFATDPFRSARARAIPLANNHGGKRTTGRISDIIAFNYSRALAHVKTSYNFELFDKCSRRT